MHFNKTTESVWPPERAPSEDLRTGRAAALASDTTKQIQNCASYACSPPDLGGSRERQALGRSWTRVSRSRTWQVRSLGGPPWLHTWKRPSWQRSPFRTLAGMPCVPGAKVKVYLGKFFHGSSLCKWYSHCITVYGQCAMYKCTRSSRCRFSRKTAANVRCSYFNSNFNIDSNIRYALQYQLVTAERHWLLSTLIVSNKSSLFCRFLAD